MVFMWCNAACFIGLAILGGYLAGAMGIATAVAVNMSAWGYISQIVASAADDVPWHEALQPTVFGTFGGAVAAGGGFVVDALIVGTPLIERLRSFATLTGNTEMIVAVLGADALRAVCVGVSFAAIYLSLAACFARPALRATAGRLMQAARPVVYRVKKPVGRST